MNTNKQAWFKFGRFPVTAISHSGSTLRVGKIMGAISVPLVSHAHQGLFGFDPTGRDSKSVTLM